MLSIKKDKTATISVPMEDDDWYIIDNSELEYKINRGFPDIDFVLDESGNVVDITYTVQPPLTQEEQTEKNTADIAYVAMMSDIDIEG